MAITTEVDALAKLKKLCKALETDQDVIEKCHRYYDGEHNLRFATRKYRESFGALFKEFSDNWCGVVVDAAVERMKIEGFRFPAEGEGGTTPEDRQTTGDPAAWDIWQRNKLDLGSEILHEGMFVAGRSYLIVGPEDDGKFTNPQITVEHPSQVYVEHASSSLSPRVAAVKRWWDEDTEFTYATLYLPDSIWKFQSSGKTKQTANTKNVKWVERQGVAQPVIENPVSVVPVIPIYNRQKLRGVGKSEIEEVIPIQDALNKFWNDMLVASEFGAFRQRVIIGMEVPEDEKGNPIPDFDLKAAINRIMAIKDPDGKVKVQEFSTVDLSNFVNAIVACRDHIAARTRTPPHYLVGKVVNVSGDALKAAEGGLVSKVKRRSRFAGEGWEEAMRIAFLFKALDPDPPSGSKDSAYYHLRAQAYGAETIWSDPEITTESALADSLAKYATLGVPTIVLWEKMGASQTEITRWTQLLKDQPEQLPPQALAALLRAGAAEGI